MWIILLHEKFLQFDWLRVVVLQLNECVKEMVIVYLILITSLIPSLCHFLSTVSEFGVLLLIPSTLVKLIGF